MRPQTVTVYSDALGVARDAGEPACQLVALEGPDAGRAALLGSAPVIVGCDIACELVLTDPRVSRRHLSVQRAEGGFLVRDLDSRNGTMFEGSALREAVLSAGATLKLGRTLLRIQPRPQAFSLPPSQSRRFGELVAQSLAMREVFAVLERAAQADVTVLVEGATGTGKELVARGLHDESARRKGPFVALDCGALPAGLMESELFGHKRGAFTGAMQDRQGAFVRAHRGTLFLDELSAIPADAQSRLLRALETRRIRPVGDDREVEVDVRVVAAADGTLERRMAEGSFRADLFYRLAVVHLRLPSLAERREDIALIVEEVLRRRGVEVGPVRGENLDRLMAHPWPGNVRELRNVLDRALALAPGVPFESLPIEPARTAHRADVMRGVDTTLPFAQAKEQVIAEFERRYLADLMARCEDNLSEAARQSGIDRKHLRHLLRRHNLKA
jgi:DNA-binding NtrC family response regulator